MHKPIEVSGIDDNHAPEILTSRVATFGRSSGKAYLPLLERDFERLYQIMRGNLRSVLNHADDYCQWISDSAVPHDEDAKHRRFERWLHEQSEAAYSATRQELRPKAIEVFQKATSVGGVFSPSDFESFGFNSIPAFRPHIRDLEGAGLLVSTQDEGDKRRKTIQVTPKGWMVEHHLSKASSTNS